MSRSIIQLHKKLFIGSIFVSLFLHIIEIQFLQSQTLWFSTPSSPELPSETGVSTIEKNERDQILKEAFEPRETSQLEPTCQNEEVRPSKIPNNLLLEKNLIPRQLPSMPRPVLEVTLSKTIFPKSPLERSKPQTLSSFPLKETITLLPHLPKELIMPSPSHTASEEKVFPKPITSPIYISESWPKEKLKSTYQVRTKSLQKDTHPSWEKKQISFKPLKTPMLRKASKIPSLSDLQASAYSSSFDTELVYVEDEEGKYHFALTLIPHADLQLKPLKQNYIFLIDRSNSIQKERLNATKSAVRKAIDDLNCEDLFNIIVFDQKIEKLAPTALQATSTSITKAHEFLGKIELGSFFSQKNLYKPLFLTLPHTTNDDELYTAILITDGESLSQKSSIESLLTDWTRMNHGKVSLYTLGMNDDPHLNLLGTIANLNRGKTISSPTNRGLKRKLLKLMKTIKSPVAKNISCRAISRGYEGDIELFPKSVHAPHLFLDEPYVILGTADSLDDFVLFVQGRINGEWLHIKKNISFAQGKRGNASLTTQWAELKAFSLFEKYLEGYGTQYLSEAKSILDKYELPEFFEHIQ
jgi:hypothetical protein